jgi:hypothetical protein
MIKTCALILAFSAISTSASAFEVPPVNDLIAGIAADGEYDRMLNDVYFFHQLRMDNAPLGYESGEDFGSALRAYRQSVETRRSMVMGSAHDASVFMNQGDSQGLTEFLDQADDVFETNRPRYEEFMSSQGIDPDGEVSQRILKSLLEYGVVSGTATGVFKWDTYIWPICIERAQE